MTIQKLASAVIISALLFFSIEIVLPSNSAYACSCMMPENAKEAYEKATHVFVGTALSTEIKEPGDPEYDASAYHETAFNVAEEYKGSVDEETNIYSYDYSLGCGMYFQDNQDYAVFAYENDNGKLTTFGCSYSQFVNDSLLSELKKMNANPKSYKSSTEHSSEYKLNEDQSAIGIIAVSFIAVVLLTIILVYIRRKVSRKG